MTEQTIHELKAGLPEAKPDNPQPTADAATTKLYNEAAASMVQIKVDDGTGSGFFVDKTGDIATDAHVVLGSPHISVITSDGKSHQARIVKLDDVRDLAIVHVEGDLPKDAKPLDMGSSKDLKADQPVWGFGHPHSWAPLYVTPGYFRHNEVGQDVLNAEGLTIRDHAKSVMSSMTPKELQDVDTELKKPMLDAAVNIQPGASGGALLDASGRVVGITDLSNRDSQSSFTPVESLIALMNEKTPKFQFDYKTVDDKLTLIDITRTDGDYRRPFEDNVIVMSDSNRGKATTAPPSSNGDINMDRMQY